MSYTVIVGVVVVVALEVTAVKSLVVVSALTARTGANVNIIVRALTASTVIGNVVVNADNVVIVIGALVGFGVIAILTGYVDSNTVLTVVSLTGKDILILIIVRYASAVFYFLNREDGFFTHSEGEVTVAYKITVFLNGVCILAVYEAAACTGISKDIVLNSVIINVGRNAATVTTIYIIVYIFILFAGASIVSYISAANAVIGKIILTDEYSGMIVTGLITGSSAVNALIMENNTALAVAILGQELVGGRAVVVTVPYARLEDEINDDMLFSNVNVVLINVAILTSVDCYISVSDYPQTTFLTAYGVNIVIYAVIVGVIFPVFLHVTAEVIFNVAVCSTQARVN